MRSDEETDMPYYCVNQNAQSNGDHEVHDLTPGACNRLPASYNQQALGYHATCRSAVQEAQKMYWRSNGCWYCCSSCHTS